MSELILRPLFAFCLTAVTIWLLLKTGLAMRMAPDRPNMRSLHASTLPRSGGAVMVAAICLTSLWGPDEIAPALWLALFLACVSLLDDRIGLPVIPRLTIHVACAALGVFIGMPEMQPALSLPLILLLVWSTNLYNFMDGANGLVGGASLIGFGFLGWGFLATGHSGDASISWIIAMSALGFLLFNIDPAKIFLGDAGSVPLGFMAGFLGILGWARNDWPAWFPLLVFSPLLVDATLTLLRRVSLGEQFWKPHCEHAYQRLVRCGWSHRHVALAYHGWMIASGGTGIWLLLMANQLPAHSTASIATLALVTPVWAFFRISQKWERYRRMMR